MLAVYEVGLPRPLRPDGGDDRGRAIRPRQVPVLLEPDTASAPPRSDPPIPPYLRRGVPPGATVFPADSSVPAVLGRPWPGDRPGGPRQEATAPGSGRGADKIGRA